MTILLQDLRYAWRVMMKAPGFALVVVISLGLGIGVNTIIFSLVNAILFRPPAVEDPASLVEVWHHEVSGSGFSSYMSPSYPDFEYYRSHNHVFSGMAAFDAEGATVSWNTAAGAENIQGQLVSGNYFFLLGVKATLGRTFSAAEDGTPGASPVVVLRHEFWQHHFGSDPAVIGKSMVLNGSSFTIIGVAPQKFTGTFVGYMPDFWTPTAMYRQIQPGRGDLLHDRQSLWLLAIARLNPGVTRAQAAAEIQLLSQQLAAAYPDTDKGLTGIVIPADLTPAPIRALVGGISGLLMLVVGMVLLIACANVTNLSLAQAVRRQGELAVRSALGARRGRLIRQMLTESVLLACLGGALGLVIAIWGAPLLLALKPSFLPVNFDVSADWRVLLFTLIVSILTGIVFGLAPAFRGTKSRIVTAFNQLTASASYSKSRLRNFLVISEIAVSLVLLIAAGLCVRSLMNARSLDPGFEVNHRLAASFDLTTAGYDQPRGQQFQQQLVQRVESLPGVSSAALIDHLPLGNQTDVTGLTIDGKTISADFAAISPGYFQTMGVPLLRGRDFSSHDSASAAPVAIVNQAFVNRLWPGQDPMGRQIPLLRSESGERKTGEIIGVVKTGKYRSLGESPRPFLYVSLAQNYAHKATLVVRTGNAPETMLEPVRGEIARLEPGLAPQVTTLAQHMTFALFPAHAAGTLLGSFGLLALVLAMVGLYGVIAYSVSQRTREIGIRSALGARRIDVLSLVLKQSLKMVAIGMSVGLVLALAATRVLSFVLYGVSSIDPATYIGISIIFIALALLASYIPARRASSVDPVVALRYE
jgi:predicted permease